MANSVETAEGIPEDIFALLGHDIRIGIIQALWEANSDSLSFSELFNNVEIADTGQFNYHLGQLVGTFIQRNEGGYEFTYAGTRVIGAILDGTYTKRATIEPFEIDLSCPTCQAPVEAEYEDEYFTIRCPNCHDADQIVGLPLPPGALDKRTPTDLVKMAFHFFRAEFVLMRNGICPNCSGTMTHSIDREFEYREHEIGLRYDCQRCMWTASGSVGVHLLSHPIVVSFYYEHGIDITEGWFPEFLNQATEVLSEDPLRIAVLVPQPDETLELIVDEQLQIVTQQHK